MKFNHGLLQGPEGENGKGVWRKKRARSVAGTHKRETADRRAPPFNMFNTAMAVCKGPVPLTKDWYAREEGGKTKQREDPRDERNK